jgi:hypothetical protein
MKKYLVIYHSTKKIKCITILWMVLLFVHLTSKNTFSYTLCHVFTQVILGYFYVIPRLLYISRSIQSKRSQITCWLQWKLHLYYFEKSPIIIYNELVIHILGFLFIYAWNWCRTNLESFHYVIRIFCHIQNTCW